MTTYNTEPLKPYVELDWTTRAGLRAVIVRVAWGDPKTYDGGTLRHLCGYVALPPTHPLHGIDYNDNRTNQITVHGGLTYADPTKYSKATGKDYPASGAGLWWFGFDCAHSCDRLDNRPMSYVIEECESLAAQLAAIADTAPGIA